MLSVTFKPFMMSVVMLNVVTLNVVAAVKHSVRQNAMPIRTIKLQGVNEPLLKKQDNTCKVSPCLKNTTN